MPKAIVLCGISGSGKSSYIKESSFESLGFVISSKDDSRKYLVPHDKNKNFWEQYKFSKEVEDFAKQDLLDKIDNCSKENLPIVIDNINIGRNKTEGLLSFLRGKGFEPVLKNLNITLDINYYITRNRSRLNILRDQIIIGQYLITLQSKYFLPEDTSDQNILIVDLDFMYSEDLLEEVKKIYLNPKENIKFVHFLSSSPASRYTLYIEKLKNLGFEMESIHRLIMQSSPSLKCDRPFKLFLYEELFSKFNIVKVFSSESDSIVFWKSLNLPTVTRELKHDKKLDYERLFS